jgi:AraC family transcriptional regulator
MMSTFWMSSYEPNSKMRSHSHDESHFTVVLQGNYDEVIDGETSRHRVGSMLFYPAGHPHSQRFGNTESRGLMFTPPGSCLDFLSEQGFALDRASHLEGGSVSHIAQRFLVEARHDDAFTELTLSGLFLEFVGSFGRRKESEKHAGIPLWLLQVRELLQEESAMLWTNEELARRANRHPVHVAKAFRRHFGETVGEFQRRLRLHKAETMLMKEHISLLDITFECGFSSQAHFSRSFKSAFGMTPSQYRSQR